MRSLKPGDKREYQVEETLCRCLWAKESIAPVAELVILNIRGSREGLQTVFYTVVHGGRVTNRKESIPDSQKVSIK